LARLALIDVKAADKTLTMHDLLYDYTREQLGDQLAAMHATLLNAYNPNGKPWLQIEPDGYLYYQLAYHLRGAGRDEELYSLLTGSSEWMERKAMACAGHTAYVADLDLAISDFTDLLAAPEVLALVKLHTAHDVVNAQISRYADTDVQTLIWLGRHDEALAHVRLRSKAKGKFKGLLTAYATLEEKGQPNPSLLYEAQEVAYTIAENQQRAKALAAMAAAMAQAGDNERAQVLLGEAQEVALAEKENWRRGEALGNLAPTLGLAGRHKEAQEIVLAIEEGWQRGWALENLIAALSLAGRYEEAREVALAIEGDWLRAWALEQLARNLSLAGRYKEAREVALSIEGDWRHPEATPILPIIEAEARAQARRFGDALTSLGPRELDRFLQTLAQWAPFFEQIKPRLSIDVLTEGIRIAGWVRVDWRKTHELLSSEQGDYISN
jgi:hypothetical protein